MDVEVKPVSHEEMSKRFTKALFDLQCVNERIAELEKEIQRLEKRVAYFRKLYSEESRDYDALTDNNDRRDERIAELEAKLCQMSDELQMEVRAKIKARKTERERCATIDPDKDGTFWKMPPEWQHGWATAVANYEKAIRALGDE